ncbi:tetratricopeptide repeat protein [Flavobacterium pallidum]|uniref:Tetratricopeptide repeat protein n=1 Tax=Flavobacterium pallidum TaxID=2172098 RepID=A0A2S1SE86_9FLAO|nr:hypothetical protein [Flavobacterium pallidum]AWI24691.1 hypothetical protein HYN49_01610 [Flavobacterium pallidum]
MKKLFLIAIFSINAYSQKDSLSVAVAGDKISTDKLEMLLNDLTKQIDESKDLDKKSDFLNQRGVLFLAMGNYSKSNSDFVAIIEIDKRHIPEAYYYKAITNSLLGKSDCDSFKKAKSLGYETDWTNLKIFCNDL